MNKLFEFFQEDNGGFSMMRLIPFVILCGMMIEWMHSVFTVGTWNPTTTEISLIALSLAGKVSQKVLEDKPVK